MNSEEINESDSYHPPVRNMPIRSSIIKDLYCIVFYKDGEWQAQFKHKAHYLPIVSSKKAIYEAANTRDSKLAEFLVNDEFTKDIVKDKSEAKKVVQEIQSSAFIMEGAINNLKTGLEPILEKQKELTEEEKVTEAKNKIIKLYGEVIYQKAIEVMANGQAQKYIVQKHVSTYTGISDRISWALSCVFAATHITSSVGGVHLKP